LGVLWNVFPSNLDNFWLFCDLTKKIVIFGLGQFSFSVEIQMQRPNRGVKAGDYNTFVKIKCHGRRPALIQIAPCSPDLGECFTYPEHVFNLSRKFSSGSQIQTL